MHMCYMCWCWVFFKSYNKFLSSVIFTFYVKYYINENYKVTFTVKMTDLWLRFDIFTFYMIQTRRLFSILSYVRRDNRCFNSIGGRTFKSNSMCAPFCRLGNMNTYFCTKAKLRPFQGQATYVIAEKCSCILGAHVQHIRRLCYWNGVTTAMHIVSQIANIILCVFFLCWFSTESKQLCYSYRVTTAMQIDRRLPIYDVWCVS
jgi:hypothetical protein